MPLRVRVPRIDIPYSYSRPVADIADGLWTNEAGSSVNLYASVDEVTADNADYIKSADLLAGSADDVVQLDLGDITDPLADTGNVLSFTYRRVNVSGTGLVLGLKVDLMEGALVRATTTVSVSDTNWVSGSISLTEAEGAAVVSYSSLSVRLTAIEG
ncbi:MAG: hypothetical protein H0T60_18655 [Acidobacteria bacterium]|nr:hypothetical protein [Acidobacteriota bacterium]